MKKTKIIVPLIAILIGVAGGLAESISKPVPPNFMYVTPSISIGSHPTCNVVGICVSNNNQICTDYSGIVQREIVEGVCATYAQGIFIPN